MGRFKLFIKWFEREKKTGLYQLIAKQLISPESTYFVGLIIPINHNKFIELEYEFSNPQIFLEKN